MNKPELNIKSKGTYLIITLIFGWLGVQKIYAKRTGKFIFWILLLIFLSACEAEGFMYLIAMIDLVSMACKSEEKFLIYCNPRYFKGMNSEERLETARDILRRYKASKTSGAAVTNTMVARNDIAIKVPGEDVNEAETHNHIKEDENLSAFYNKSQDKLDRFQNNNYFPSTNSTKIYDRRTRSDKIKEAKEELKSGLISKEEFNEKMKNI